MLRNRLVSALTLCVLGSMWGCQSEQLRVGECESDKDCDAGYSCRESYCRCVTDDACGEGEYCNPFGTCQIRPACLRNADCNDDEICNSSDPSGGKCIPADSCGSSVHCPIGQFCPPAADNGVSHCQPGCRSTGDCPLGEVCAAGECVVGSTAGDCSVCPTSPTPDASYCDYGELCTREGACEPHDAIGSLCNRCESNDDCAEALICLVDDEGGQYCAPECENDLDCPSGYDGCGSLHIVGGPCDDPLAGGSGPCECTNTGTCPNGGVCIGSAEGNRAYCECVSQEDCNFLAGACMSMFGTSQCMVGNGQACNTDQDCACQDGRCLVGGFPCRTGADCVVSCVQVPFGDTTVGKCETSGRACGKDTGVTCQELTTGAAPCQEL